MCLRLSLSPPRHAAATATGEPPVAAEADIDDIQHQRGRRAGSSARDPIRCSSPLRSGARSIVPGMMDLHVGGDWRPDRGLRSASSQEDRRAQLLHSSSSASRLLVLRAAPARFCEELASPREWRGACGGAEVPLTCAHSCERPSAPSSTPGTRVAARRYRQHHGIAGASSWSPIGCRFGNLDSRSGTGVLFSRNPTTGSPNPSANIFRGHRGRRRVQQVHARAVVFARGRGSRCACRTSEGRQTLEKAGRDVQDVEFTVERGRLYLRRARRSSLPTPRLRRRRSRPRRS